MLEYEPRSKQGSRSSLWPLLTLVPTFAGVCLFVAMTVLYWRQPGLGSGMGVALGVLAIGAGGLLSLVAVFFFAPLREWPLTKWWKVSTVIAGSAILGSVLIIFVTAGSSRSGRGMGP